MTREPLRVLICPDKFKGTLTAAEAAAAIESGWAQARPDDQLRLLPMTDGGDGFEVVIRGLLGAERQSSPALDAAHQPHQAPWSLTGSGTAIIESASIIGLAMLPPGKFHPRQLDTQGLGLLLRQVDEHQPTRILLGLGGSATNDAGYGMAKAIGWQFLDAEGAPIDEWQDLVGLQSVRPPDSPLRCTEVQAVVDVSNPLLGSTGATRIYGPQKGLLPADLEPAEAALSRLAEVISAQTGTQLHEVPGAGAAGGLGFGVMAFLDARLVNGFELFRSLSGLNALIEWADIVITGEGAMDRSSLMGKGVGRLIGLGAGKGKRCLAFAGVVDGTLPPDQLQAYSLIAVTTLAEAKARPAHHLAQLAARVASEYKPI